MIRLFTALEIPGDIAERLGRLQHGLPGARWIDRDAFHLTLCFIGEVTEPVAEEIDQALSRIEAAPFDVQLHGIGEFGHKKPHTVWAGVSENPALHALQAEQETLLRRLRIDLETRKYTPHVTLTRTSWVDPLSIGRFIEANNLFETLPFPVTRFVLFSARLSRGGGPYVAERIYPLENTINTPQTG